MPAGEICVDPPEIFLDNASVAQSIADSATTNVKAQIAKEVEDQRFVYKKQDNAVVLILKMKLPQNFNLDKQELYFGFQMATNCLRFGNQ